MTILQIDEASKLWLRDHNYQECGKLPDNARVWRPPAATVAILTPGFSVTRHGNAERVSSPDDELSAACFTEDILLLLVLSSPLPLASVLETLVPIERET